MALDKKALVKKEIEKVLNEDLLLLQLSQFEDDIIGINNRTLCKGCFEDKVYKDGLCKGCYEVDLNNNLDDDFLDFN